MISIKGINRKDKHCLPLIFFITLNVCNSIASLSYIWYYYELRKNNCKFPISHTQNQRKRAICCVTKNTLSQCLEDRTVVSLSMDSKFLGKTQDNGLDKQQLLWPGDRPYLARWYQSICSKCTVNSLTDQCSSTLI